jgi:predicted RNA methylase
MGNVIFNGVSTNKSEWDESNRCAGDQLGAGEGIFSLVATEATKARSLILRRAPSPLQFPLENQLLLSPATMRVLYRFDSSSIGLIRVQ